MSDPCEMESGKYIKGDTTVTVNLNLSAEEFKQVGLLLGQDLGRRKGFSERYAFTVASCEAVDPLLAYLRTIKAAHEVETVVTWTPSHAPPQGA